ncbi:MAG: ABC transporter ATP-binding protein [Phreatobacter sp.]|uniref:ABC transporter ATP-binding protein n=1 Tax=Phreatobacter sp. TaxID=1966341 RepID=UPI001A40DB87|nr:ABC transporter ATP-binding protein [Phreatobacter sp.]MBL8571371.1 ABC transporter ATP-binding protein [Phreatobacter sp.]
MDQSASSPASIGLDAVSKSYDGRVRAVDAVSLDVKPGEFFSLLGPSGCGKTTTLRMIAGFETVDTGRIRVGDRDVTDVPVHKRDMGMVFQSYALFPHRTVAENVAFGLRMRKVPKAEIEERVRAALALVALTGFEDRRPGQLSGGQQQRVALARAIVIRPPVLLCDEPLGALDRKLRQQMQFELKQLQKELGVTLVFVTHDQEEALAMSDRIAVMNAGRIEQIGTPTEIYDRPKTRFVADFIGEINLIERPGGKALAVRPEKIVLGAPGAVLDGTIDSASFLGGQTLYRVALADGRQMLVKETNAGERPVRSVGDRVGLAWAAADGVELEA